MLAVGELTAEPQFYSVEYSRHVRAHLDTLWDKEQMALKRQLDAAEKAFIQNELLLSRLHYPYWAERYTVIYDFARQIIPFRHNIAQQFLLAYFVEMEEAGDPIMVQILKLRQLGISSIFQRAMGHKALFYANADILCASNDPDKTFKLLDDNIGLVYENLPWWMLRSSGRGGNAKGKDLGIYESGEIYCQFTNPVNTSMSKVTVQHGNMKSDLGRGTNPTSFHGTELPDWADPASSIEGGLKNAIHENPFLLYGLESSASSSSDAGKWWEDTYNLNVELWPQRKTRLRPIFIPWYVGTDVWPTEGWLSPERRKALADYTPSPEALGHAKRAHAYVHSEPMLHKLLGADWELPKHQLMFWEYEREYAVKKDRTSNAKSAVKKWLQEIGAADAAECFQSAGTSIFDFELIESYRNKITNPIAVYQVECKEISQHLLLRQPRELDASKPAFDISRSTPQGTVFKAQFRPLVFDGYRASSPNSKLFIWQPPVQGAKYTVSYDDAHGVQKDNVAIQVIRHATYNEPAEQVAEWAANNYDGFDAWSVLLAIAEYYAMYSKEQNDYPLLVIELAVNGETVQKNIMEYGYNNLYARFSNASSATRNFLGFGWITSEATRPRILGTLIKAINDNWFQVNSPYLIDELEGLKERETLRTIRIEAGGKYRDDRALSAGIGLTVSVGEISPSSLYNQTERFSNFKRRVDLSTAITPAMAQQLALAGNSSLLSFGSAAIVAPELNLESTQVTNNFWEN